MQTLNIIKTSNYDLYREKMSINDKIIATKFSINDKIIGTKMSTQHQPLTLYWYFLLLLFCHPLTSSKFHILVWNYIIFRVFIWLLYIRSQNTNIKLIYEIANWLRLNKMLDFTPQILSVKNHISIHRPNPFWFASCTTYIIFNRCVLINNYLWKPTLHLRLLRIWLERRKSLITWYNKYLFI